MFDLVLRNGTIVDGTGAPRHRGDVALKGGQIAAVGEVGESGAREIDVEGLVIAPGFIDPHTHYDAQITWDTRGSCSYWHGVTTVLIGNCGFGIAPCKDRDRKKMMDLLTRVEDMPLEALENGIPWDFQTYSEYLRSLESRGLWINVGGFVPHSTLRMFVMDDDAWERTATEDEIAAMAEHLREALADGAIGLSTSIHTSHVGGSGRPIPSRVGSLEEIHALCRAMRDERRGVLQIAVTGAVAAADLETIAEMSRQLEGTVTFTSVRQVAGDPSRHQKMLERLDELVAGGLSLWGQVTSVPLHMHFTIQKALPFYRYPTWEPTMRASWDEMSTMLKDPEFRRSFARDLEAGGRSYLLDEIPIQFKTSASDEHRHLDGKTIVEIGELQGKSPLDAFFDLAADDPQHEFEAVVLNTSEDAIAEMIRHDRTMVALSDAGAHVTTLCEAGQTSHFLGKWVRERQTFSLEEGVRQLTSLPASVFGLSDRGRLAPGLAADVVVFDADRIRALPPELVHDFPGGASRMVQRAEGVVYSFVHGTMVVEEGKPLAEATGPAPGSVVKPSPRS